jgi:hypothetical protein
MCSSLAAGAALCAFASGRERVLCLAHVTNAMGQRGEDFEKGEEDRAADALRLLLDIIRRLAPT